MQIPKPKCRKAAATAAGCGKILCTAACLNGSQIWVLGGSLAELIQLKGFITNSQKQAPPGGWWLSKSL
jgi:hypothetical protein